MTDEKVTPHIFGKPMEKMNVRSLVWALDVAGCMVQIHAPIQGLPYWCGRICTDFGENCCVDTLKEAEEFLEAALLRLRDRINAELPQKSPWNSFTLSEVPKDRTVLARGVAGIEPILGLLWCIVHNNKERWHSMCDTAGSVNADCLADMPFTEWMDIPK
ncbi:MAG: hypothetical protein ACTS8S_00960 [Giesbergeria sp.]